MRLAAGHAHRLVERRVEDPAGLAGVLLAEPQVLLLDEPINHLDIPSRARFEQALRTFEGTMLAVIHDRYFMERFATEVWWVENGGLRYEFNR